jgi:hypothetical protein
MWIDILGYVAAASVLVTFCMTSIVALRIVGLVSNVLFISFGALAHIYPIMILHLILFPINTFRLVQLRHRASFIVFAGKRETRHCPRASDMSELPIISGKKVARL